MVSDNELKKSIAHLYLKMSEFCNNQSESINNDLDSYVIQNRTVGYELETNDKGTYQLVLEFKKRDDNND